jgi:hypothetical protein
MGRRAVKEAMLYQKLEDRAVRCQLCAHRCTIKADKVGICGVRQNRDGTLYSLVYGKAVSAAVDPVEKKPLYHFHPGATAVLPERRHIPGPTRAVGVGALVQGSVPGAGGAAGSRTKV